MKAFLNICLLLSLGVMVSSCNENEVEHKSDGVNDLKEIAFESLSKDVMGNPIMITQKTLLVVQNQEDLDKLWENPSSMMEKPSTPEVDFEHYVLVVAASGERPSSGYTTEIERIEELEDEILVFVTHTEPGEGCMNLTVMTTPHHIVKIQRPSKNIVFSESIRTNPCI